MRSKLDQKLREGSTLKIVETKTASRSPERTVRRRPFRGRHEVSMKHLLNHRAVRISTMIRKKKFFPVIKGKNKKFATRSGVTRSNESPQKIICFCNILFDI